MKVIFVNDRTIYNKRYRQSLMNFFYARGYNIRSIGIMDSPIKSFFSMLNTCHLVISSNLKSNLLTLIINPINYMIILNGLGRFRRSFLLRYCLVFLLKRSKGVVCIQNYADYRFFRLFAKKDNINWVPGSGGTKRNVSSKNKILIVSRKAKLKMIAPHLKIFSKIISHSEIVIVGCSSKEVVECGLVEDQFFGLGYVNQSDLFSEGNTFLQLPGYGEGVPHTLVDAVCSDMNILITKSDFIQFGLRKLDMELSPGPGDFYYLQFGLKAIGSVSLESICQNYYQIAIQKKL